MVGVDQFIVDQVGQPAITSIMGNKTGNATAPISRHLHAVAIGRAKVDGQSGSRWATDEKAVRFLLNGLRRWQPKSRAEPDQVTMQGDAVPVVGGGVVAVGLTPGLR